MRFCSNCDNMLYISKASIDGEPENQLSYQCKCCNYRELEKDTRKCIYENIYKTTNTSNDITNNKYIRHDPTLPRINTMKCINKRCVSNIDDIQSAIILSNLDIHDDIDTVVKNIETIISTKPSIQRLELDYNNHILYGSTDELLAIYDEVNVVHPHIDYRKKIEPQIIFIKYDANALKYVYICDYCNTSWKNN